MTGLTGVSSATRHWHNETNLITRSHRLRALKGDAVIRFVRVIKLDPKTGKIEVR